MDTTRFTNCRDEFPILDFVAAFEAKTDSSISFNLGRFSNTLLLADMNAPRYIGERAVFNVFGWADVHHPCHGHVKTRLRILLTDDLMTFESQRDIVNSLLDVLAIPRDETFEASIFTSGRQEGIQQPIDRNGCSDGAFS
jgi:hypothetical protein